MAQHTQMRLLIVPTGSEVPVSEQTMKCGNESLPSHTCKNVVLWNALVLAMVILNACVFKVARTTLCVLKKKGGGDIVYTTVVRGVSFEGSTAVIKKSSNTIFRRGPKRFGVTYRLHLHG